ncbi:MAG: Uncharacterised protein [Flavobacteriaceae bacterium]|jgi:hypothetical protein|nr:MAG: Uncharacterised protein [Flavobacteriaceae bacterium]
MTTIMITESRFDAMTVLTSYMIELPDGSINHHVLLETTEGVFLDDNERVLSFLSLDRENPSISLRKIVSN